MKKRIIALILTMTMTASMLSVGVFAKAYADPGEAGKAPAAESASKEAPPAARNDREAPRADQRATAPAESMPAGRFRIEDAAGGTREVPVPAVMSGRVVDADGNGVAAVSVQVYDTGARAILGNVTTDPEGQWSLDAQTATDYSVRFYKTGFEFSNNKIECTLPDGSAALNTVTASARNSEEPICNPWDYTYELWEGNAIITGYSGAVSSIMVPESIDDFPVTEIGAEAFSYHSELSAIYLPDTILAIGSRAFCGCSSLISIDIPSSVNSIGSSAFSDCSCLEAAYFYGDTPEEFGTSDWYYDYPVFYNCAGNFKIYYIDGKEGWTTPSWNDYATETFTPVTEEELVDYPVAGGSLTFDVSTGTIVGYQGAPTTVVVPAEIEEMPVTAIAARLFSGCDSLRSVTIPEGVTKIGSSAFCNCGALGRVTLPGSLTEVGSDLFRGCLLLTDVTLTEGITALGASTFFGCSALESVTLPDSLTEMGSELFRECTSLTDVTLPAGITGIPAYMFCGCGSLTEIELPETVTSIGDLAFFGSGLTDPVLPAHLRSIGNYAFAYCYDLTELSLPGALETIGEYAFLCCSALTEIELPDGVTSVGSYAFSDCGALESVTLTGALTEIPEYMFQNCSALTEVAVPAGVTDMGSYAFYYCTSLTDVSLPEGLTGIGSYAFYGCSSLRRIDIPSTVTAVSDSAFSDCGSLEAAYFCGDAPGESDGSYLGYGAFYGCAVNFRIYYIDGKEGWTTPSWNDYATETFLPVSEEGLVDYPVAGGSLTFDVSTGTIVGYKGAPTTVVVPAEIGEVAVTAVAACLFSGCGSLRSVTIPAGVTKLGSSAFYNCGALQSVTLPGTLTEVGGDLFRNCTSLTDVTLTEGIAEIPENAFCGCGALAEIELPETLTSIGRSAFEGCGLTEPVLPAHLRSIGDYAFAYCCDLSELRLPGELETIGEGAFQSCGSLREIELPNSVTSVGSGVFNDCGALESVTLPEGLTEIPEYMFQSCGALTAIKVPTGVTDIGSYAFYSCASLANVSLPEGLTGIGSHAFYSCSSLRSINIPSMVNSILNAAFSDCGNLEAAYFYGDAPEEFCTSDWYYDYPVFYNCAGNFKIYYIAGKAGWTTPTWNGYATETFTPVSGEGLVEYPVAGGGLIFDVSTGTIVGYRGSPTTVVVPTEIEEMPVTAIAACLFSGCESLISITIPAGVTKLGSSAFYGCSALESVTLPGTLTEVGSELFRECTSLTEVTLAEGIAEIPENAFCGCGALAEIELPETLESIGRSAFEGCVLTDPVLPEHLRSIGDYAFAYCCDLSELRLPGELETIGEGAFQSCGSLTEIELPDSVTSVGSRAFGDCGALTGAVLPGSLTEIPEYMFQNCGALTEIQIPAGVTDIGSSAFYSCSSLTEAVLPEGLTGIGSHAFYSCSSLRRIDIPSTVNSIYSSAFAWCSDLEAAYFYGDAPEEFDTYYGYDDYPVFCECAENFRIYYIDGKEGWTTPNWNDYATETFMPVSEESLVDYPVEGGSLTFDVSTGVIVGCKGEPTTVVMPAEIEGAPVTAVAACLFSGCGSLISVTIPAGVTKLGSSAFFGCTALESAVLPGTLTEVGSDLFRECTSLTEVTLADGITVMGANMFYGCSALESVTLPEGIAEIPEYAFYCCGALTEMALPETLTSIGSYAFSECGLTELVLPEHIKRIEDDAFAFCYDLTELRLPGELETIGEGAFACDALTEIELPDSVTSVGSSAFSDCGALTRAVLSGALTEIPDSIFYNCGALTEIEIPAGVTNIGSSAFNSCTSLTDVSLPEGLTGIGSYAFFCCTSLRSIDIPSAVNSIFDSAFRGCSSLEAAYFYGDAPEEFGTSDWYYSYPVFDDCAWNFRIFYIDGKEGWTTPSWNDYDTETFLPVSEEGLVDYPVAGGSLTFDVSTGVIAGYKGAPTAVVVPAEIEGTAVTTVAAQLFSGCESLISVAIPQGVTRIGSSAFCGCTALESVTLPGSLMEMGSDLFGDCTSLTDVTLTDGIAVLGANMFYGCTALESVTLPGSLMEMGSDLFRDCTSLTDVTLTDGITALGVNMFYGCSALESVALPEGIMEIPENAFCDCGALAEIELPETLMSIGDGAFNCCALTDPVLPEHLKSIQDYAFAGCGLTELRLPGELETIGERAFAYCSSLTEIELPNSVTSIGNGAFYGCAALERVTLPEGLTEIPESMFESCGALTGIELPAGVTNIGSYAFCYCTSLADVSLPEGLTGIGIRAFYCCSALTSIMIPGTLTEIYAQAFACCSSLASAYFYGDTPTKFIEYVDYPWNRRPIFESCAENFRIYYISGKEGWSTPIWNYYATETFTPVSEEGLIDYAVAGGSLTFDVNTGIVVGFKGAPTVVVIPAEINGVAVRALAAQLFAHCGSLRSITLPEGLTGIGSSAFYSCEALERVTLPRTLTELGSDIFKYCPSLTKVTLREGLTVLGNDMFYGCEALESVTLPGSLTEVGSNLFQDCTSLTEVTLTEGITALGAHMFHGCSALESVTIPEGITEIPANAFDGCGTLTEIVLPETLTSIGNAAFYGCGALTDPILPEQLRSIGDYAFAGCGELTEIELPDSVTSIGNGAFSGCRSLTSVTLPNGLTEITDDMFNNCEALTEIELPDSVKRIGSGAFYYCPALTEIELPNSVTGIGSFAFYRCSALTSIVIPGAVTEIYAQAFARCDSLAAAYFCGDTPKKFIEYVDYSWNSDPIFEGCAANFKIYYIVGKAGWTTPAWNGYPTVSMELYNGHYYEAVESALTWEEAAETAERLGGCLAVITDAEEEAYAASLISGSGADFWLGGTRLDGGAWSWCIGEEWSYAAFPDEGPGDASFLYISDGDDTCFWSAGTAEEEKYYLFELDIGSRTDVSPTVTEALYPAEGGWLVFSLQTGEITGYQGEPSSIHIPKSIQGVPVRAVSAEAFASCSTLEEITADEDSAYFSVSDGILYSRDGSRLLLCPKAYAGSLAVPEGTAVIGAKAFCGCTALEQVSLPDTVTVIEDKAFYGCTALQSAALGSGLRTIGASAFRNCTFLGSIALPEGCSDVGSYAFAYCDSLTEVSLPDSLTSIPEAAFFRCRSLPSVTMPETLVSVGSFAFSYCDALTGVFFPGDAPALGRSVFPAGDTLTLYYVHGRYGWTTPSWNGYATEEFIYDSNPAIRYYAVAGGTVKYSVETGAVVGYSNAPTEVIIPAVIEGTEITAVEANAFSGCSSMTVIYLPNTVTSIGSGAFDGCSDALKIYGEAGSAAEEYATAEGIAFVACGIASVYPPAFSTIGGAAYTVEVEMTGDIAVPLEITAENESGVIAAVPAADSPELFDDILVHTYTLDLSGLQTGTYLLRFCRTEYGIDSSCSYYIDRSAPEKPRQFAVTPGNLKNILTWDTPAEADVERIAIYRSTGLTESPELIGELWDRADVSFTDTDVEDTTEYFYWVSFTDRFGQESEWAGPIGSRPGADTEPPVITSVWPVNGSCLSGAVGFTVSAADNKMVKYIAMEVSEDEGGTWQPIETVYTDGTAYFTLDSTAFSVPVLNVRFTTADIYDNIAVSDAVYSYSIDNTPPERVTGVWAESVSTAVTLHWNDVEAADFSHFIVETENEDGSYSWVCDVTDTLGVNLTGLLPNTAYTYRIAACDVHGNVGEYSEPVTVSTQADAQPPVITGIEPSPARFNGVIPLVFTVSDNYGIRTLTIQTSADSVTWTDADTVDVYEVCTEAVVEYDLDTTAFPEGSLYVRGIGVDYENNASDASASAPYVQYMIDRTAPAVPEGLEASVVSNAVRLTWRQGTEQDLNGYNVYRSTEEDGEYTLLTCGLTRLSYVDVAVTSGQTYYYRLSCQDSAGNVSEACDPVAVFFEAEPDTEPPQIISISPSDGYTLGPDTPIRVKVYDNQTVAELYAEYSVDGMYWEELEAIPVGLSTEVVTLPLTAGNIDADLLMLRVRCTDTADLSSETVSRYYAVDKQAPDAPALTAAPAAMSIELHWTCGNEEDLAGFYIYRKAAGDDGYTYLAQFPHSGETAYAFLDSSVSADRAYSYYVSAVDTRGNLSRSAETGAVTPLNIDIEAPVVRASGDTVGTVGIEMSFSAAGSYDNVGITAYLWDFGDGSTSNLLEPVHAYEEAGDYTVTLTVEDAAGNSTSGQIGITVKERNQAAYLDVTVIDENGQRVPGAGVYFNLGADSQTVVYTDDYGFAHITAEGGTFTVGAYKSGYLPAKKTVTLVNSSTASAMITLVQGDIVVGELTVERMTLAEIQAAGINTADPANQEVFQFEIRITYGADVVQVNTITNGDGTVLVDPEPVTVFNGWDEERILYPFIFTGGGEGGGGIWGGYAADDVPLIVVLDLPGTATWLKDFFDVRLYVLNQADEEFVLDDCTATLNVPFGLTLVESNRTGVSETVSLGSLPGQSSVTAEWIIRGDEPGDYDLSADFSGILRDFNEPVTASFQTSQPFHVRQGDDLYLDVVVENAIVADCDSAVRVGLRNENKDPYYLPNLTLDPSLASLIRSFKTNGRTTISTSMDTLWPGETIWWDYVLAREHWETLYENMGTDFWLYDAIVEALGGPELPYTIRVVMPFTISGDLLEVYQLDQNNNPVPVSFLNISKDLTSAEIPSLLIRSYRLNENMVYEPCPMELRIEDEKRADIEETYGDGSPKISFADGSGTAYTDENGELVLDGYTLSQFILKNSDSYTIRISSKRARPVELPVAIRGKTAETGLLRVCVYRETETGIEPITEHVSVTISGKKKSDLSNRKGEYEFKGVDQGYEEVTVEVPGYLSETSLTQVSGETEVCFILEEDTDPNASCILSIKNSLSQYTYGNYTVIPVEHMPASDTIYVTPVSRIAEGDAFVAYHYRILRDGAVAESGEFTGELYFPLGVFQPDDVLQIALETEKLPGTKYRDSRIFFVDAPDLFGDWVYSMQDISGKQTITLTEYCKMPDSLKKQFEKISEVSFLEASFSYDSSDESAEALVSEIRKYVISGTETQWDFPVSVKYDLSGKLTFSLILGKKATHSRQNGLEGGIYSGYADGNGNYGEEAVFFSITDKARTRYTVHGAVQVDFVLQFEPSRNCWELTVYGQISGNVKIPLLKASFLKVGFAKVTASFGVSSKWELVTTEFRDNGSTEWFSKGFEPDQLEFNGELKGQIGAKLVDDSIASASVYAKGGLKIQLFPYFKVVTSFSLGDEENFLLWSRENDWINESWELFTNSDLDAMVRSRLSGLLADDAGMLSLAELPENGAWSGVTQGTLIMDAYGQAEPSLAELPDGRVLMVWTGYTEDPLNPVALYWSVCDGSDWTEPARVLNDGTADLWPALVSTADGAVLVWSNFCSGVDEEMASLSAAEIMELADGLMEVCVFRFGASGWSEEARISCSEIPARPAVTADAEGGVMAAWIAAAYSDGDYDCAPAWAYVENGAVTRTGTIESPDGKVRSLALGYAGGSFRLAALVDTGTAERLYASDYVSDHWGRFAEASSITQTETAMCFDSDGRLLFLSDGRLFVKDGAEVHQLFSSDLISEDAGSLCALDGPTGTVVLWTANTDAGCALCACVLSDGPAAAEPFILSATESGLYSMLSTARCGSALLLVFYSAGITEDALEKKLEVIRIDSSVDVAVNAESIYSSNALMPGAQVTTYLSAVNAGLGDPGGIIAEIRNGGTVIASASAADAMELAFSWTVPSDYGGEAYSLTVLPLKGTDADLSNNTVELDNMIRAASVEQAAYFGRIDGKDSFSVTVENTGMSETGGLTLTVRLLNSGDVLLEQEIDSIPYGGCSVIRVDLDPLEEDTAFLAFLLSSDSDTVDCSGNYLAVTRPVQDTIEVLSVSWLDGEGEPLQQLTAGPVQVRYTVKNAGDGREYTVILAAYTSAGQMITSGTSTVFIGASECCDITAALDLSTFGGDFFVKAFLLDESSCPVGSPSQPD